MVSFTAFFEIHKTYDTHPPKSQYSRILAKSTSDTNISWEAKRSIIMSNSDENIFISLYDQVFETKQKYVPENQISPGIKINEKDRHRFEITHTEIFQKENHHVLDTFDYPKTKTPPSTPNPKYSSESDQSQDLLIKDSENPKENSKRLEKVKSQKFDERTDGLSPDSVDNLKSQVLSNNVAISRGGLTRLSSRDWKSYELISIDPYTWYESFTHGDTLRLISFKYISKTGENQNGDDSDEKQQQINTVFEVNKNKHSEAKNLSATEVSCIGYKFVNHLNWLQVCAHINILDNISVKQGQKLLVYIELRPVSVEPETPKQLNQPLIISGIFDIDNKSALYKERFYPENLKLLFLPIFDADNDDKTKKLRILVYFPGTTFVFLSNIELENRGTEAGQTKNYSEQTSSSNYKSKIDLRLLCFNDENQGRCLEKPINSIKHIKNTLLLFEVIEADKIIPEDSDSEVVYHLDTDNASYEYYFQILRIGESINKNLQYPEDYINQEYDHKEVQYEHINYPIKFMLKYVKYSTSFFLLSDQSLIIEFSKRCNDAESTIYKVCEVDNVIALKFDNSLNKFHKFLDGENVGQNIIQRSVTRSYIVQIEKMYLPLSIKDFKFKRWPQLVIKVKPLDYISGEVAILTIPFDLVTGINDDNFQSPIAAITYTGNDQLFIRKYSAAHVISLEQYGIKISKAKKDKSTKAVDKLPSKEDSTISIIAPNEIDKKGFNYIMQYKVKYAKKQNYTNCSVGFEDNVQIPYGFKAEFALRKLCNGGLIWINGSGSHTDRRVDINIFQKISYDLNTESVVKKLWGFIDVEHNGSIGSAHIQSTQISNIIYRLKHPTEKNIKFKKKIELNDFRHIDWVHRISKSMIIIGVRKLIYTIDFEQSLVFPRFSSEYFCYKNMEMLHREYGRVFQCEYDLLFTVYKYNQLTGDQMYQKLVGLGESEKNTIQKKTLDKYLRTTSSEPNFLFLFGDEDIVNTKDSENKDPKIMLNYMILDLRDGTTPRFEKVAEGSINLRQIKYIYGLIQTDDYLVIAGYTPDKIINNGKLYLFEVYRLSKDYRWIYSKSVNLNKYNSSIMLEKDNFSFIKTANTKPNDDTMTLHDKKDEMKIVFNFKYFEKGKWTKKLAMLSPSYDVLKCMSLIQLNDGELFEYGPQYEYNNGKFSTKIMALVDTTDNEIEKAERAKDPQNIDASEFVRWYEVHLSADIEEKINFNTLEDSNDILTKTKFNRMSISLSGHKTYYPIERLIDDIKQDFDVLYRGQTFQSFLPPYSVID